ncbi:alpha-beta hydrolase superfamily lysophospholipase [Leeuwenhoekiella aestuarii]|uniref:Alpha-beta hydrolase superfamily lysophospholipase n=1 Tax=Leeuwenhoekiella aestuarii TaxID=2249426 RepID=A0A4Q0NVU6_9FLAO|nr:alpha/beta hydrolase [Leeuwenhoekiella aestuarii]RXG15668.1 alpha-beta hydrolase superfamily lysophospholipase [Leeuwenhoekiella aestuarii]RXG17223.1 alpha-beta hydrolase superfamily lysophospholipase [Leeuwenhoekiella aestuarii]
MQEEIYVETFKGQTARHELFGKLWKVPNQKAVVCIIHGFGEHLDRYEHVAQFFNIKKISCYAVDLPGHGKSSGKRGVVRSLQDYILAVDFIYEKAVDENPDTPVFLYGHSMGGGIVLRYLLLTTLPPKGALVTSPWLKLVKNPGAFKIILGRMALTFALNPVQQTKLNPDDLSRDPEVGKAYLKDELVHGEASTRLFFGLNDNGVYLMDKTFDFKAPVLLAHGTADKITNYKASKILASRHQDQIKFKSWKDLRHETHNELNKEEVLTHYTDWILSKV